MISYDAIDYSIHPIPWLGGDLLGGGGCRGWGGVPGIGGIKRKAEKLEFCVVEGLKKCTNLGCKWGVTLVIGGGWGVGGGCHICLVWGLGSFWVFWVILVILVILAHYVINHVINHT
jgi:hypothetical protein